MQRNEGDGLWGSQPAWVCALPLSCKGSLVGWNLISPQAGFFQEQTPRRSEQNKESIGERYLRGWKRAWSTVWEQRACLPCPFTWATCRRQPPLGAVARPSLCTVSGLGPPQGLAWTQQPRDGHPKWSPREWRLRGSTLFPKGEAELRSSVSATERAECARSKSYHLLGRIHPPRSAHSSIWPSESSWCKEVCSLPTIPVFQMKTGWAQKGNINSESWHAGNRAPVAPFTLPFQCLVWGVLVLQDDDGVSS